ncbi:MAG TPA: RNA polymerase sigma factor [Candidatus Limnocylindrales bacterium]|jgi:RNA polymerase sigma-70 factor (ECF subfamily)|nr:RNA polymerase sigma factor [Candidatus Limnocylindrales bacterium]
MQAQGGGLVETAFIDHGVALVRHLTQVTRDGEAAQDLAQEAFLRLAREVEAGRTPDNPSAWLHRVGFNLATSRGRHLQVGERRAESLLCRDAPATPEELTERSELTRTVVRAMHLLSSTERRALLLAAHGYTGTEIAASIDRTHLATRTMLCRARAKVRAQVDLLGVEAA